MVAVDVAHSGKPEEFIHRLYRVGFDGNKSAVKIAEDPVVGKTVAFDQTFDDTLF